MGRIADWLGSQTTSRRFRRLEREARELLLELTDALEKLNTMAARLAKREARAKRDAQPVVAAEPEQMQLRVSGGGAVGGSRKSALRARAARLAGMPMPPQRPAEPCEGCDDEPPEGV